MKSDIRDKLIYYINHKNWWRTCLPNEAEINNRGLFLTSSFKEAEFYGRPIDTPFKVNINAPLIGDNDYIEKILFDEKVSDYIETIADRFKIDKEMKQSAQKLGFDSIVLMSEKGYMKYCKEFKIPKQIELNIFNYFQNSSA